MTLLLAPLLYASFFFALSRLRARSDLADLAWGLGFIVLAWLSYLHGEAKDLLPNILVTIWGLRLAWHIGWRLAQTDEDRRYVQMRRSWHPSLARQRWRTFLQVFVLQAYLILAVGSTLLLYNLGGLRAPLELQVAATLLWLFGFTYESLADFQLRRFLARSGPKPAFCSEGLWRYSRHPNYFGELVQWWALGFYGLVSHLGLGLLGPALLHFLICKISGLPLLRAHMARKEGYAAYAAKTPELSPFRFFS